MDENDQKFYLKGKADLIYKILIFEKSSIQMDKLVSIIILILCISSMFFGNVIYSSLICGIATGWLIALLLKSKYRYNFSNEINNIKNTGCDAK